MVNVTGSPGPEALSITTAPDLQSVTFRSPSAFELFGRGCHLIPDGDVRCETKRPKLVGVRMFGGSDDVTVGDRFPTVRGNPSIEISGKAGDDDIRGNTGAEVLEGDGGDDSIKGRGGTDS